MLSKTHTKYIQSLQHKKFRDEAGMFLAEGPKVVMDLLTGGKFICKEIFALQDWMDTYQSQLLKLTDAALHVVADFELQKLSALSTAHEVLAVFEKIKPVADMDISSGITLALDTIQDPGNLGTIIRTADWFGVRNIICSSGCADMYNTKVVQSTMGSLGRVNIVYANLVAWLQQQQQVKIYAASLHGKDVKSVGKLKAGILIIGNEANGVSEQVMELVHEKINIPRIGEAESLNAAVATGIIVNTLIG